MAVLTALPEQAIINALKGTIDYYLCRGVPCARKWPHWPKRKPTPAERANQEDFATAIAAIKLLQPSIIEAWQAMAVGTGYTWRDLALRGYMSGW